MAKIRGNCKKGGVAEQIYNKTNLSLIRFCELNGLSYGSFLKGYYSKKAKKILKKLDILIDDELKVS